jgi:hypothetical protein
MRTNWKYLNKDEPGLKNVAPIIKSVSSKEVW